MTYKAQAMTIAALMRDIDDCYLPAIQREFVWSAEKTEALFDSLLREYPIGSFLLWEVRKPAIHDKFVFYGLVRDYDEREPHNPKVSLGNKDRVVGILDGQQRITSLVIGLLGSRRDKMPRKWRNNPDAYPLKKLYMNLLFQPKSPDDDQKFQIKFLNPDQARPSDHAYWFPVGDVLPVTRKQDLRDLRRRLPYDGNPVFEDNLEALWSAVHERDSISYFLETREDLDVVLDIFVRLNTGGTPLSYSDLLLSLATATWRSHDARQEVYGLTDYLNKKCGTEFSFSKDFVMKSLLVLNEKDVRFRAENVSRENHLERIWPEAERSLKLAVKLVSRFGFNAFTLSPHTALIPVVYYIYKRGLSDGFMTQKHYEDDREEIRRWLLRVILGRVFRGQTDQTLSSIRGEIRDVMTATPDAAFPARQLDSMLRTRRGYYFTEEDVQRLVDDTSYGDPLAFATLALLLPNLSVVHSQFHVDHMHPDSAFTKRNLSAEGMDELNIAFALENYNRLPNLQILTDFANEGKRGKSLVKWLEKEKDPGYYRTTSLIPDVDLALSNFREFYASRRQLLVEQLKAKLGVSVPVSLAQGVAADQLVTGEESEV